MGMTALHRAVQNAQVELATKLLEDGADPNATDFDRVEPLHLAAQEGSTELVQALLRHGADVNAVGFRHNETPLHIAALYGHDDVAAVLLEHGADPSARNMLKKTALDFAVEGDHHDVAALLRAGAEQIENSPSDASDSTNETDRLTAP